MAYRLKPATRLLRALPPHQRCKSSRNVLVTIEIVIKFTSNAGLAWLLAA
jgi:hypothetical protein